MNGPKVKDLAVNIEMAWHAWLTGKKLSTFTRYHTIHNPSKAFVGVAKRLIEASKSGIESEFKDDTKRQNETAAESTRSPEN